MSSPVHAANSQPMSRSRHAAATLAFALLALAPLPGAAAYLPKVGPAPLRFVEEVPRLLAVVTVVTVSTSTNAAAETGAHAETNAVAGINGAPEATPLMEAHEPIILTAKSPLPWFDWLTPLTPPPAPPRTEESSDPSTTPSDVTPQAMIPFFQSRTREPGGQETATWGAVAFRPPVPGQKPESKATFLPQAPAPSTAPPPAPANPARVP
ncbi:MAG: hypothetical protein RJA22_2633 [Verrucomicrobiota bacterium]